MAAIEISQFRVGESNYNYIAYNRESRVGMVVDPLDADQVLSHVRELDVKIKYVLNTHGHPDHTAGNQGVIKATGAKLIAGEKENIPGVNEVLKNEQVFSFDGISFRTLLTPGHTAGHITLVVNDKYLIVGDTLFVGGCGNCRFGGDPDQLYASLELIKKLPDNLIVCCGHEYAMKNLNFCKIYEPQNRAIDGMLDRAKNNLVRRENISTTLREEKNHNIFLRTQMIVSPKLGSQPLAVFKKLRELRNDF